MDTDKLIDVEDAVTEALDDGLDPEDVRVAVESAIRAWQLDNA